MEIFIADDNTDKHYIAVNNCDVWQFFKIEIFGMYGIRLIDITGKSSEMPADDKLDMLKGIAELWSKVEGCEFNLDDIRIEQPKAPIELADWYLIDDYKRDDVDVLLNTKRFSKFVFEYLGEKTMLTFYNATESEVSEAREILNKFKKEFYG